MIVPGHVEWDLILMRFQIVTNAVVGPRNARLLFGDGTSTFSLVESPFQQNASELRQYEFNRGRGTDVDNANTQQRFCQLPRIGLLPGWSFSITPNGFQAGDVLSNIVYQVIERSTAPDRTQSPGVGAGLVDPDVATLALGR